MEEVSILRVNTSIDENDGSATEGTGLSLRDAVLIANSTPEDQIIELESNVVYELSIEGVDPESIFVDEDSATQGDLDIGSTGGKLTIRGLGEGATIDANEINRVIQVRDDFRDNAATLVLENITVTGGKAITEDILDDGGGGIYVDERATAELINCTITGNSAPGRGSGGGVSSNGTLTIRNCNIYDNSASNGGGVFTSYGNTQIFDSTITNNTASQISNNTDIGDGGGVNHKGAGITEIVNSSITNNNAGFRGGGVVGESALGSSKGTVIVTDSFISGNTSNSGGGIASDGVESMTVTNTTIENNVSNRFGGGVAVGSILDEVTIANTKIRNNNAEADGGGIHSKGTLTVRQSTISGNTAKRDGGGVNSSLSTASIVESTIEENSADGVGGGLKGVSSPLAEAQR